MSRLIVQAVLVSVFALGSIGAQGNRWQMTPEEQAIMTTMGKLRDTPDDQRGAVTKELALRIRKLPTGGKRAALAYSLANLATEGDFGHSTLQEVATTLADALRDEPQRGRNGLIPAPYLELASLARYEHVSVHLDDERYAAAVQELQATHDAQAKVDFTLRDITGKAWKRSALKGKVVLVNFWATWCPPCRKEMPDLQRLYDEFRKRGLVVLAISDEPAPTVDPFIAKQGYTFPILLDPGRSVNTAYHIQGIPNSFLYNRQGRLVAQAIDMRTRGQFLKMLAQAGLR
ncbi:MAG TPA: TlpA disulfide reductase family protein [Fimbriimonadaceae bacterium]|nr:TlpA disulfide reductase family protein [Fimbriimonadaceae bacterium]